MIIKLSPYAPLPGQFKLPAVALTGDVLTIDEESFDFSQLPDGATLPAVAIESEHFVGPVERINGELHLTLRLPNGPNPSRAVAFPEPVHVSVDGPVSLPFDPAPEQPTELLA
jgi:hypothetical protein